MMAPNSQQNDGSPPEAVAHDAVTATVTAVETSITVTGMQTGNNNGQTRPMSPNAVTNRNNMGNMGPQLHRGPHPNMGQHPGNMGPHPNMPPPSPVYNAGMGPQQQQLYPHNPNFAAGQQFPCGKPGVRFPTQQPLPSPSAYGQHAQSYPNELTYMQLGAGGPRDMNGPCPQRPGYDGHSSFTQQDGSSRGLNHMFPQQQQQQQQQSMSQNPNCNKSLGPPHAPINGVPPPPMMPGFYPMHMPYNNTQLNMVYMNMIPKGSVMGQTPVSSTSGPGQNAGPRSDELRLTFPIRDGVLLPPFRTEPNHFVSKQSFVIWAPLYKWLKSRSDIELHLKCFLLGDREMNTNWPTSVSVMVNTTLVLLTVERGDISLSLSRTCVR